jgi:nucleoside-diphosphate-sugar epimerase
MSKVVVTGSDGFVGRSLTDMLTSAGHQVIPVTREQVVLGDRQISNPSLASAMRDSQALIHLAGRAHVTNESHADPLGEFRRVNLNGTLALADMAASAGVTRFVFVSSIGVLGNASGSRAFNEGDTPSPKEPYAVSKWEAEQGLHSLARNTRMQIVVVRPPLAYGPNVKGNFLRLLRLAASGVPLPLGAVDNCRSYVGVHNLCDFLISCAFHLSAGGRTFHVADGKDVSTPELIQTIAAAMGGRARMFRCPRALLRAAAAVLGKSAELNRLTANLRVDSSLARATLEWRPTKTFHAGIEEMARWYMRQAAGGSGGGQYGV